MSYKAAVAGLKGGAEDYQTLSVVELKIAQERANISGISSDEEEDNESGASASPGVIRLEAKEERTGATHLVHCWYPLGHAVSES
jgi:hypothetical protein